MNTLAKDFAETLTDMRLLEFDIKDPMRHSKRKAKDIGLKILRNAVDSAREVVGLPALIEADFKGAEKGEKP